MEIRTTNFENTFYSGKKIILSGGGGVTEALLLNAGKLTNLLCICDRKAPANGSGTLMGYPYMQIQYAVERYSDFYVAISSLKYYAEMKADWMKFIPEDRILPYQNWETRLHFNMEKSKYNAWLHESRQRIETVYHCLGDEASRQSFCYYLQGIENISADNWLRVAYHSACIADYFPNEYFKFDDKTIYIDVGGCDGDTVFDFIRASNGSYRKIIAYEPDEHMFHVLQEELSKLGDERIVCCNAAVGDHSGVIGFSIAQNPFLNTVSESASLKVKMISIDSLDEPISMIKVSLNGEDNNIGVLEGVRECILKYKPDLSFIVTPNENVLIDVPIKILEICNSYKIYFRLSSYSQEGGQRFSGCIYASAK